MNSDADEKIAAIVLPQSVLSPPESFAIFPCYKQSLAIAILFALCQENASPLRFLATGTFATEDRGDLQLPFLAVSAPPPTRSGPGGKTQMYTTTTERNSFGKLCWPLKDFPSHGRCKNPIRKNKGNHVYHRILSWPLCLLAKKSLIGAGWCMVSFSLWMNLHS